MRPAVESVFLTLRENWWPGGGAGLSQQHLEIFTLPTTSASIRTAMCMSPKWSCPREAIEDSYHPIATPCKNLFGVRTPRRLVSPEPTECSPHAPREGSGARMDDPTRFRLHHAEREGYIGCVRAQRHEFANQKRTLIMKAWRFY